jgi:hypothetical protein
MERDLNHLSNIIWECPSCKHYSLRFDTEKNIWVCWKCVTIITLEDVMKQQTGGYKGQASAEFCWNGKMVKSTYELDNKRHLKE